jgi:membrane protein YqaA with SNARE-associated domain
LIPAISPLTAYATLFGWSFLAATVLPLGSEPVLFALARSGYGWIPLVLVATAGNYLGACTTYYLGRQAARAVAQRVGPSGREHRAAQYVRDYGQPIMVFSWVPIVGDALVAAAGAAEMPFGGFSFWVVVGKALRYAAVAWGSFATAARTGSGF